MVFMVLWERWFSDVANAEMLDDSMQKGYALLERWSRGNRGRSLQTLTVLSSALARVIAIELPLDKGGVVLGLVEDVLDVYRIVVEGVEQGVVF